MWMRLSNHASHFETISLLRLTARWGRAWAADQTNRLGTHTSSLDHRDTPEAECYFHRNMELSIVSTVCWNNTSTNRSSFYCKNEAPWMRLLAAAGRTTCIYLLAEGGLIHIRVQSRYSYRQACITRTSGWCSSDWGGGGMEGGRGREISPAISLVIKWK